MTYFERVFYNKTKKIGIVEYSIMLSILTFMIGVKLYNILYVSGGYTNGFGMSMGLIIVYIVLFCIFSYHLSFLIAKNYWKNVLLDVYKSKSYQDVDDMSTLVFNISTLINTILWILLSPLDLVWTLVGSIGLPIIIVIFLHVFVDEITIEESENVSKDIKNFDQMPFDETGKKKKAQKVVKVSEEKLNNTKRIELSGGYSTELAIKDIELVTKTLMDLGFDIRPLDKTKELLESLDNIVLFDSQLNKCLTSIVETINVSLSVGLNPESINIINRFLSIIEKENEKTVSEFTASQVSYLNDYAEKLEEE